MTRARVALGVLIAAQLTQAACGACGTDASLCFSVKVDGDGVYGRAITHWRFPTAALPNGAVAHGTVPNAVQLPTTLKLGTPPDVQIDSLASLSIELRDDDARLIAGGSVLASTSSGSDLDLPIALKFEHRELSRGGRPYAISVADLDGDNRLDAMFTEIASNTPTLFQVSFAQEMLVPTSLSIPFAGMTPDVVWVGDSNGNRQPEVVVANTSRQVGVLEKSGATWMQASITPAVPHTIYACFMIDLDQNGRRDLVAAGPAVSYLGASAGLSVFPGLPTVGVSSTLAFPALTRGGSATFAGDLNGDGKPDLITTGVVTGSQNSEALILMNTSTPGAISFAAPQVISVPGPDGAHVVAADFNRDGHIDLALASESRNSLLLRAGTGPLTFAPFEEFFLGSEIAGATEVLADDFNGDGLPDLVVLEAHAGGVSIMLGGGPLPPLGLHPPIRFSFPGLLLKIAIADLDGDGQPDLLFDTARGGQLTALFNRTQGGSG